ncbi:unnamed protein product [Penicillium pancosmium]
MSPPKIPPEIWHLIFKAERHKLPTRSDLANVCSVSRLFDTLATPLLYRSVILCRMSKDWSLFPDDFEATERPKHFEDLYFGLFYRLLDDRNEALRAFVREMTFNLQGTKEDISRAWDKLRPPQDLLAGLVRKLPNLEAVYFIGELPISDALVDAFIAHQKSPKLYLKHEEGLIQRETCAPFVPEVCFSVDTTAPVPTPIRELGPWEREFKPQRLALHEIFAAYPNLEDLSVSINLLRGGCVIGYSPASAEIVPLSIPDEFTFPPLKHLSLSGYNLTDEEKSLWKQRFPWGELKSLTLGVQTHSGVLESATGNVHNLKKFEITSYTRYTASNSSPELDLFLSSFSSLESLTAKGLVPSMNSVMNHSNLKHLCLHAIEETDQERKTLNLEEIEDLDLHCPNLTGLELDINPNGTWPNDTMEAIATKFENLRELIIHVGLGISIAIRNAQNGFPLTKAFKSVLTEEIARASAKRFLECRGPSNLKKITLKTGEDLRWFPQWHPGYADAEEECSRIFEIDAHLGQDGEISLKELDSTRASILRSAAGVSGIVL